MFPDYVNILLAVVLALGAVVGAVHASGDVLGMVESIKRRRAQAVRDRELDEIVAAKWNAEHEHSWEQATPIEKSAARAKFATEQTQGVFGSEYIVGHGTPPPGLFG